MENEKKEDGNSFESNIVRAEVEKKSQVSIRENPWIIATVVLIVMLVGLAIVNSNGGGSGRDSISGDEAAQKLVGFIEAQSTDPNVEGSVEVISVERDGSLYQVNLNYQGQDIPVYVSADGKYLLTDVIPLDSELGSVVENSVPRVVDVEIGDSPSKGDVNAPVTIVEFSDYQCPFCSRFYTDTLSLLDENYIKTGKVRLVYMDFPLDIHPEAQPAAEAARCVRAQLGDDGYFKMHDKLFENQGSLNVENYKKWAREMGAKGDEFDNCLDSGEFTSAVQDDLLYGSQLGVSGTPGFFVNGKVISGAQPYGVFEQIIEAELAGLE
jgi:protein-disulfide isomerase